MGPIARDRVRQAVGRFAADVHHPGLDFEKLKGSEFCTIRVTRGDRIVLRQSGPDAFELVDVGEHDTMHRRYG
ncbi:MAG: hypothetical protein ABI242_10870 [Caulobacteraceae bacterium]